MLSKFEYLSVIKDEKVRMVFSRILSARVLSRSELNKMGMDENELSDVLSKLQSFNLIDKKTASFEDLDKYFPTAEGLELEKMM